MYCPNAVNSEVHRKLALAIINANSIFLLYAVCIGIIASRIEPPSKQHLLLAANTKSSDWLFQCNPWHQREIAQATGGADGE